MMDPSAQLELSIFADYNVIFLLAEPAHLPGTKDGWVAEVVSDMIAASAGAVCIGTARRMDVPVLLTAQDSAPEPNLSAYDHVTEASLSVPAGSFCVVGGSGDVRDARRLSVPPADYRVRVCAGGFGTVSEDGLDGDDRYELLLWPAPLAPPQVLKRYRGVLPGG